MHPGSISIRIQVVLSEIDRLNRLVRLFGELHEIPSRALYSVNLALDELVSNAVLYGFSTPEGEEIEVCIEVTPTELCATVKDRGLEFNPLTQPAPDLSAPLEERQLSGLGIHLVRNVMDRLEYAREDGQNVLTIHKRIRRHRGPGA